MKYKAGIYDIKELAPQADKVVINAFKKMGMICKIDPTCTSQTVLNMKSRVLTLKSYPCGIYVQLGYFIFAAAGDADTTSTAKSIFTEEKFPYFGASAYKRKKYFAECYNIYVLNGANALKSIAPKTLDYLLKTIDSLEKLS